MECPSPECRKNVEGMRRTLFGRDGAGGVVGCMKEKVPKRWLWWIILAFGLPAASFAATTWYKAKSAELRFATVRVTTDHEARIRVLESRTAEISQVLKRIEDNQGEFRSDIKKLLERTARRE